MAGSLVLGPGSWMWMEDGLVMGPAGIHSYELMGGTYHLTAGNWLWMVEHLVVGPAVVRS